MQGFAAFALFVAVIGRGSSSFQVPLTETNLLPCGDHYGDTCLTGLCTNHNITSQNVSKELEIEDPYVFYGQPHYKVIVCEDGVVSFNDAFCNLTYLENSEIPRIIGVWEDFYITETTSIYFTQRNEDNNYRNKFGKSYFKVMHYLHSGFGQKVTGFDPTRIFVATWNNVEVNGDLITFQIVLATEKKEGKNEKEDKNDTYGLLIYEDDLTLNNDQLFQIGLHAGDGRQHLVYSSSFSHNTNIGIPGVYAYRIDNESQITQPVSCEPLADPVNGIVKYNSRTLNSIAIYTCTAVCDREPTIRVCKEDGWSESEPQCPAGICPTLKKPENGNVTIQHGQISEAFYTCNSGYMLVGDAHRMCDDSKAEVRWTGKDPMCINIQLRGGNEMSYGIVEVYHKDEWRSVCDDHWTDVDANVACGQLGFLPYGASAITKGEFKPDEPTAYWMDDVKCKGNEASLFNCPHRIMHNCGRKERAGVHCFAPRDVCIRLLPDENKFLTGSIELNIDGEWRSICYTHWTNEDARVACKQLGFPYNNATVSNPKAAKDDDKFWLDFVSCEGDEENLLACDYIWIGKSKCDVKKKATVTCG